MIDFARPCRTIMEKIKVQILATALPEGLPVAAYFIGGYSGGIVLRYHADGRYTNGAPHQFDLENYSELDDVPMDTLIYVRQADGIWKPRYYTGRTSDQGHPICWHEGRISATSKDRNDVFGWELGYSLTKPEGFTHWSDK